MPTRIEKSTLLFLQKLSRNNNRDWFNQNKNQYLTAHENMIAFADSLLAEMQKHDHIETMTGKHALMRIYRDIRFSKDKTPYRTYMGGGFRRATKRLRGGYYFQVGPDGGLAAGGFFGPNREDLLRIRKDIDVFHEDWKKVLRGQGLSRIFGEIKGDKLISAPRGFPRDHVAIDLLRLKQFYFERIFSPEEVLDSDFLEEVNDSFRSLRPYLDFMSQVLTTDGNGVSIID
ncbi:MAG: DUF2461 domain-containing protein [Saprospiraceae bacterium]|nr:DUF2461 domain-containing protein [Saprospiraceae bacterium]